MSIEKKKKSIFGFERFKISLLHALGLTYEQNENVISYVIMLLCAKLHIKKGLYQDYKITIYMHKNEKKVVCKE